MRNTITILPLLFSTGALVAHDGPHHRPGMDFHPNGGQWPQQVLYRVTTPGGALFLEPSAFTHVLETGGDRRLHGRPDATPEPHRAHAFKVHFEGGRAMGHEGRDQQGHYVNYFLGDEPSKWATGLPVYGGVDLHEVWPGIGLRVKAGTGIKYDWLVAAGADPSTIVMRYEGQDKLEVANGLLHVRTSAGDVVEQRPVAWQEVHGARRPVDCRFKQDGDRITFELPFGHDPRYPLVIDPVLVFSSYSGSFGDNFGFTATYDASGHLYGGGMVRSTGYPVTTGVVQSVYGGGENDIAVSKFSPDGTTLVWSTYIGGSVNEVPHSMVVNDADELYILGTTNSPNFPTTPGCWSAGFNGGNNPPFAVTSYGFSYTTGSDIVVVHLNSTATAFIGSTYVGGAGNDGLNQSTPTNRNYGDPFRGEIIVDLQQNPLIVTSTASAGLFTSADATQPAFGGGLDAYAFRMDPALSNITWATYYGGSGIDAGFGVQIASNGEIYITGGTTSTDLPMAGPSANPTFLGNTDGFIARFHPSGSPLLSSTYVGTTGFDQSYFVQLNTNDEVFVVGQTTGPYPITPGKYNNPNATQFLHKFSGDLSTSLWSTRIGGAGNENVSPSAFLVSNCGQIYFSGWAGSTNAFGAAGLSSSTSGLPVTSDAFQSTTNGSDFYLMMLEPEAISLGYATFFGGTSAEHVDGGTSRFDKNGIVYQAVCAGCQNLGYPTTPGVWSTTNNSTNCNLGVFKMDFEQNVQVTIDVNTADQTGCLGVPIIFTAIGTASFWAWDFGDGSAGATGVQVSHVYAAPGVYVVMLIGSNADLCLAVDTAYATVTIIEPPVVEAAFDAVPTSDCQGFSVELFNFSTGAGLYQWQFGDGGTSTLTNPVHGYASAGSYDITLLAIDPLCGDTDTLTQTIVLDPPSIDVDLTSPIVICFGGTATIDAGPGFQTYQWSTGATSQTITVAQPGTYSVAVTDGICEGNASTEVVLAPQPPPASDVEVCPGVEPTLAPTVPVTSIAWSTGATTPTILADQSGIYWFVAVDTLGCTFTDSIAVIFVQSGGSSVVVPNVFSPNKDNSNDTFQVGGDNLTDFRMEIFNRWGMLMYETNNPNLGWNGGLENTSDKVPDGTYYYVVTFRDRCSTEPTRTETGHVTLLR